MAIWLMPYFASSSLTPLEERIVMRKMTTKMTPMMMIKRMKTKMKKEKTMKTTMNP